MIRRQARARASAIVCLAGAGVVTAFVSVVPACTDLRRSDGEACVKSDDCLSNVCSGQMCTSAFGTLDDAEVESPIVDAQYPTYVFDAATNDGLDAGLGTDDAADGS